MIEEGCMLIVSVVKSAQIQMIEGCGRTVCESLCVYCMCFSRERKQQLHYICLSAKIMENKALDNFPTSFRTPARNPLPCSQNTLSTDNQISFKGRCSAMFMEVKSFELSFALSLRQDWVILMKMKPFKMKGGVTAFSTCALTLFVLQK